MPIIQTTKQLRPRDKHDFYPTPLEFCQAGVNLIPADFTPDTVLDAGAGTGVWGLAARQRWQGATIVGVELRDVPKPPAYNYWYQEDFRLMQHPADTFDCVIGNPPYKYAERFIRAGLEMLSDGGYLAFLLRLAFLESVSRLRLWQDYPPFTVSVCANRPSFTGDGKTNATAFCYFVWQKNYYGDTQLQWTKVA